MYILPLQLQHKGTFVLHILIKTTVDTCMLTERQHLLFVISTSVEISFVITKYICSLVHISMVSLYPFFINKILMLCPFTVKVKSLYHKDVLLWVTRVTLFLSCSRSHNHNLSSVKHQYCGMVTKYMYNVHGVKLKILGLEKECI